MKNILIIIAIIVLLSTSLIIISKIKNPNIYIDFTKLAEELKNADIFEDNLSEVDKEMIINKYEINDNLIKNVISYIGSGATAEEILLIEVKNQKDVNNIKEIIKKKVEEKKESYKNYLPDEVYKLENYNMESKGNYIAFCVSNNTETALQILNKYFK